MADEKTLFEDATDNTADIPEDYFDDLFVEENETTNERFDDRDNGYTEEEDVPKEERNPSNAKEKLEEKISEAPEQPEGRGNLFLRFGRWAQEHIPEWAYRGFWGFVHLVGKTIRTLVFGEENVTRDAAKSFERTMDAERYKAEKASGKDKDTREAKEQAKETSKEAETAQKAKEEEKVESTRGLNKKTVDAIQRTGHKIADDPALNGTNIIKLSRELPDGRTKDCYIRKSDLEGLNWNEIQKAVQNAARHSAAQRYLDNHNLVLAAVGKDRFIVERPSGAYFSFDNAMMKDKLSDVVKEFKEMEAKEPNHMEPVSKDMRIPVTENTLHSIILKDVKEEKQVPDQVIVKGETEIPEIKFTTTEELKARPFPELTRAGYLISEPDKSGIVKVEDPKGSFYSFLGSDYRMQKPEIMQATFVALQRIGAPQGKVCDRVPDDFHHIINSRMTDLLAEHNLAMAADENGDAVYVFEKNSDGSVNMEKSWTLSQSSLVIGDATDLKKIIFEINNKDEIERLHEGKQDYMITNDVEASAEAVGIVSAMCSEVYQFSVGETLAVAQTELTKDQGLVTGTNHFDIGNAKSLNSLSVKLDIAYESENDSVDVKTYTEDMKSDAENIDFSRRTLYIHSEIDNFLKEPSDEIDHGIGMAMISAEKDALEMPKFTENQNMDPSLEDLQEIEPYNYDDIEI